MEAAFRRSAVWQPAEAARAADRPADIGPTDATVPIGMETVYRWHGGAPNRRAATYSDLKGREIELAEALGIY